MIEIDPIVYAPKEHIGKVFTYDHRPITDMLEIYNSEFLLIQIDTPTDFFEIGNRVKFNSKFTLGWGGFYPDPQKYSDDKKFIQYGWRSETHYKFWLGGVYEYKGELYAHTYWT
jgi:hypothetical protein